MVSEDVIEVPPPCGRKALALVQPPVTVGLLDGSLLAPLEPSVNVVVSQATMDSQEAYDSLDPTGNITIKWDVMQWTPDGYMSQEDDDGNNGKPVIGSGNLPFVALRAGMDALPIQELELENFITHEVPFSGIYKAFEYMLQGDSLRCIKCMGE